MNRGANIAALALASLTALALAGCGNPSAEKPASTLTEAQRDSVLGESALPGANTVTRAREAAAGEGAPRVSVDSLTR
jgi:hypothetical protein